MQSFQKLPSVTSLFRIQNFLLSSSSLSLMFSKNKTWKRKFPFFFSPTVFLDILNLNNSSEIFIFCCFVLHIDSNLTRLLYFFLHLFLLINLIASHSNKQIFPLFPCFFLKISNFFLPWLYLQCYDSIR